MKSTLNLVGKPTDDAQRRGPSFLFGLFGGRIRTSTVVLIVAFVLVAWVYHTYRPEPESKPPAPQVVPPGFVPDPNYTWVPRTRVDHTQQPTTTAPIPPTPTESTTPSPTTTTTTTTPFTVPCLVPALCPPSTSPPATTTQQPLPGPGPVPTSAPPAR